MASFGLKTNVRKDIYEGQQIAIALAARDDSDEESGN